jgi:hypothetical protein
LLALFLKPLFSLNSYLVSTYICKAQESTKLLTYSSYNGCGKGDEIDEMDLMLVIDGLSYHWFFLSNHVFVMKKLLWEAWVEEVQFSPKMITLGKDIIELECKVQASDKKITFTNILDMFFVQQKLLSF